MSPQRGRVVVIGAGMAGLGAARMLVRGGYQVTVLEGRNRVGGRLFTDRSLGVPMDLGANWIEGSRGNPITALAREFQVRTKVDDGQDSWLVYRDGRELDDDAVDGLEELYESILLRAQRVGEDRDEDASLGEALRAEMARRRLTIEEREGLEWLIGAFETDTAEDLEKCSLWDTFEDEEFEGDDLLVPGGYDAIATGLARGLDIRLGRTVTGVVATEAGVRVSASRTPDAATCAASCHAGKGASTAPATETFDADWCVVAVPLGPLKSGAIAFDPPLPYAKRRAIDRIGMGALNIIAVKWDRVFWPREAKYLSAITGARGEFPEIVCWNHVARVPILKGFSGGRFSRRLEESSDENATRDFLSTLRKLTGARVPDPVGMVRSRWGLDHWTGGSYSYSPPGVSSVERRALAAPFGRVLFAGEATESQYPATVHGAYLSGLREARRIVRPD